MGREEAMMFDEKSAIKLCRDEKRRASAGSDCNRKVSEKKHEPTQAYSHSTWKDVRDGLRNLTHVDVTQGSRDELHAVVVSTSLTLAKTSKLRFSSPNT